MTKVTTKHHSASDLPTWFRDAVVSRINQGERSECWEWRGYVDRYGYANARFFRNGKTTYATGHRVAYLVWRGPIEPGLVLDHLCRNRACCNPWHMEAVTNQVNISRGLTGTKTRTHCKRGHPFTSDNERWRTNGYRICQACYDLRLARLRSERRMLSAVGKVRDRAA